MNGYETRISEVEKELQANRLIGETDALPRSRVTEQYTQLLKLQRQGHALTLSGYKDGTVAIGLETVSGRPAMITLLARPNESWHLVFDPLFARYSAELSDLLDKMPEFEDVGMRTFSQENALLALTRLVGSFAALPG
jgi:hypothetical protein